MIDFSEIEKEVMTMEAGRDTTYATISRLAPLYTALLYKALSGKTPITQSQPVEACGDSEFFAAIKEKDSVQVFAVLDELFDTIRVVNPRLYEATLRKFDMIAKKQSDAE